MHRVPYPLKVVGEQFYAFGREGIKGHTLKTTVVGDFLVKLFTLFTHCSPQFRSERAALLVTD